LFFYAGLADLDEWLLGKRILPHEFSHHYQWVAEGFPCLIPKGAPKELVPQFAKAREFGPEKGSLYVDNLLVGKDVAYVMKDFSERVADHVCEGILLERGLKEGMLEDYRKDRKHDPAKDLPLITPNANPVIKYLRRLALYDTAEWHSFLQLAYPDDSKLKRTLRRDGKWVVNLNQDYEKADQAFEKIYSISLNTNLSSLKESENMVQYAKTVMRLLGINVRTDEKW
jgi:hypothetical protein